MAKRFVAVQIGSSQMVILKIRKSILKDHIENFHRIPFTRSRSGIPKYSYLHKVVNMTPYLKNLSKSDVILQVPLAETFFRNITIRKLSSEKSISTVIKNRMRNQFTVPLDELWIRYQRVSGVPPDDVNVNVFAVPLKTLKEYKTLFDFSGCGNINFCIGMPSLPMVIKEMSHYPITERTVLYMNIGALSITLAVFKEGGLTFFRCLPYGGDELTMALKKFYQKKDGNELSFAEAEKIKLNPRRKLDKKIFDKIYDRWIEEIKLTLKGYAGRKKDRIVEEILLDGSGGSDEKFPEKLSETLDIPVTPVETYLNMLPGWGRVADPYLLPLSLIPFSLIEELNSKELSELAEDKPEVKKTIKEKLKIPVKLLPQWIIPLNEFLPQIFLSVLLIFVFNVFLRINKNVLSEHSRDIKNYMTGYYRSVFPAELTVNNPRNQLDIQLERLENKINRFKVIPGRTFSILDFLSDIDNILNNTNRLKISRMEKNGEILRLSGTAKDEADLDFLIDALKRVEYVRNADIVKKEEKANSGIIFVIDAKYIGEVKKQ